MAASQLISLLLHVLAVISSQVPLATLDVQLAQPAVAGYLQVLLAGITGTLVAGLRTGMGASFGPGDSALQLTLPAVCSRVARVRRLADLVTVPGASVVAALQRPAALPSTGGRFGHVTGKVRGVVRSEASYRNRYQAIWTGQCLSLNDRSSLFPGNGCLLCLQRLDLNPIVTGCRANVTAF